jgi:PKD repeat protein
VTLTVTDINGDSSTDSETIIVVADMIPSVSIIANITNIVAGQYVEFTAIVSGGNLPLTWIWNFGDGTSNISTQEMVVHQFNSTVGTPFTVTLTIVDANGDEISDSENIVVEDTIVTEPTDTIDLLGAKINLYLTILGIISAVVLSIYITRLKKTRKILT